MIDDLEQKIEDVKSQLTKPEEAKVEAQTETSATKTKRKVVAKKTVAKKVAAKKAVKTEPSSDKMLLADIAADVGIDAAKARRILRGTKIKNPGRWAWDNSDKDTISAVKAALKQGE